MAKVHFNLPRKISGSTLKSGKVNFGDKITKGNSAFNSLPSDFSAGSQVRQTRQYRAAQGRKGFDRDAANKAQNDYFNLREARSASQAPVGRTVRQQRIQTKSADSQQRVRSRGVDREASQKAQNEYFDLKEARANNQRGGGKTRRQQIIQEKSQASQARHAERMEQANDPRVQQSAFNRLPEGYATASPKAQTAQYNRGKSNNPVDQRRETSDAYERFHQERTQSADQARENYFNRLDEKKANKQQRRRDARQAKKDEQQGYRDRVQGYKDQINASREETRIRGGGARSGAGMTEEQQLSMMKEDIGTRFRGNGGWGGVGRGAVQGAAIGGLAGGTVESMQGGDFWDGAKSGAMMGATGMAGLRAAKQATGAKTLFRGENSIMNTYNRQTEQYGVGVKALMMNNRMANKAKDVMNWKKDR